MTANHSTAATLLVAVDISKFRHEVLIGIPGKKRRRRMTITNTQEDFRRLSSALVSYDLPVRIGFEATGNYHRPLAHHLGQAGFDLKPVSSVGLARTREVRFNARLHAFARYWGFTPRACAPYRARTKGKDERGVGYVKKNAIAGRRFESWAAFEAHLDRWTREVADQREHGTTGVAPAERFADEARALRPLADRAPFGQLRDLVRKVRADCAIDLDTNSYSVPWRLIGESVQVVVLVGRVIIRHAGQVVADHVLCRGRRQRIVDRAHFVGVAGFEGPVRADPVEIAPAALLRPLAEYEAVVGGAW